MGRSVTDTAGNKTETSSRETRVRRTRTDAITHVREEKTRSSENSGENFPNPPKRLITHPKTGQRQNKKKSKGRTLRKNTHAICIP